MFCSWWHLLQGGGGLVCNLSYFNGELILLNLESEFSTIFKPWKAEKFHPGLMSGTNLNIDMYLYTHTCVGNVNFAHNCNFLFCSFEEMRWINANRTCQICWILFSHRWKLAREINQSLGNNRKELPFQKELWVWGHYRQINMISGMEVRNFIVVSRS